MVERMVLSLLMSGLVGEWSILLGGILVAGRGFLCEISFCLVTHLHFFDIFEFCRVYCDITKFTKITVNIS